MKTVCKKLLCLMLVAMMLISAVPFAFANDTVDFWVELHVDGEHKDSKKVPGGVEIGTNMDEAAIKAAAQGLYAEYFGDGYTYVGVEGAKTVAAANEGCEIHFNTKSEPEHTHSYTSAITTQPTCVAEGVKTFTCSCGDEYTEPVSATGKHNFEGNECTMCDATRGYYKAITFNYMDSDAEWTSETVYVYASGDHVTPPYVPVNPECGFSYWAENENGTGDRIKKDETLVVNSETPEEFTAIYNKKSAMSELKIYAVRYVNGVRKEANYLFSEYFTTSNDNDMYQYLWDNSDEIFTAAVNEIGAGYTWNEKFYNYFTDEELTDANMKDNGNKSVYIKMNTKNSNEAQVLLYVHKGKTSAIHEILEMNGYNAGETVYIKDVKNFLDDEGYSWSSISSLYTDEEWDDLLDGESPSGSNSIKINDNGTYKIHVMLNGASKSNNADSSNPKTGDYITAAATTMALAAAGLVSVLELKKRKMI